MGEPAHSPSWPKRRTLCQKRVSQRAVPVRSIDTGVYGHGSATKVGSVLLSLTRVTS